MVEGRLLALSGSMGGECQREAWVHCSSEETNATKPADYAWFEDDSIIIMYRDV